MATPLSPVTTIITMGNYVIGGALGLTIATSRQKLPVYALGSTTALGFGRGRRIVTGTLQNMLLHIEAIRAAYYQAQFDSSVQALKEASRIFRLIDTDEGLTEKERFEVLKNFLNAINASYKINDTTQTPADQSPDQETEWTVNDVALAHRLTPIYLDELHGINLYVFYGKLSDYNLFLYTYIEDVRFLSEGIMITNNIETAIQEVRFTAKKIQAFNLA